MSSQTKATVMVGVRVEWFWVGHFPWGKCIGHHYEAFIQTPGGLMEIRKCVTKDDRLKFYAFVRRGPLTWSNRYGWNFSFRSRSLRKTLEALMIDSVMNRNSKVG